MDLKVQNKSDQLQMRLTNTQTLENKTLKTPFIKDTDATPTADRKLDCKDGIIGTYSGAVEIQAISKNSLQPIDNDGIEGAANIDKSKISSTGTWSDGDLPSTVMHTDIVQNKTVQQTFSGSGTSISSVPCSSSISPSSVFSLSKLSNSLNCNENSSISFAVNGVFGKKSSIDSTVFSVTH